jgi:hypothetical protein
MEKILKVRKSPAEYISIDWILKIIEGPKG